MSTIRDVTQTLAFKSLLGDDTTWYRQTYGDAMQIAWKGRDSSILSLHTLFANYDTRPPTTVVTPDGPIKVSPRAPRLSWLSADMGTIYTTEARLFETLRFYFDSMLRYHRETGMANPVPSPVDSDIEDEVTPDWEAWIHDDQACAKLAVQAAHHFIEHFIQVRCFMPEPPQTLLAEHSIGRGDREDRHATFESLVDQAATA